MDIQKEEACKYAQRNEEAVVATWLSLVWISQVATTEVKRLTPIMLI
jgi:hypothetical protein